ncbi:MAG: Ldh family oxidoreductase [Hyphomicrobiales bacterium]
MAEQITIKADVLRDFTRDVFRKAGLVDQQAAQTAAVLVWADLRGHPSHGVIRIPTYTGWIASGQIDVKARPKIVLSKGAVVRIDGEGAIGPAAMVPAADAATARAREHAVAWVLVQNHTHAGAVGYYAQCVAEAGMVAIVMSALRPMMAYHGTRGAAVSTNPIAIAMPGGIMLDMSTSAGSRGKLGVAKATGKPLPPGIALDRDGRPTTDANLAETLLPVGGAKGAGLSLMFECMTSAVLGSPLIASALRDAKLMKDFRQNSLLIAMDPSVIGSVDQLKAELAALASGIKSQQRAEGFDEILLPGERGARSFAARSRDGVPIPPKTWQQIVEVAGKLGVGAPEGIAA